MDNDELGELGETKLRELAAQAEMVSNPARRDRTGFDSLLELKVAVATPSPDLVPTAFRAFIQAKAKHRPRAVAEDNDERRVSIKLSNWQRMVSDTAPWFIFVAHVDEQGIVYEAFLVHVDDALVEKAVKALREATRPIHDIMLSTGYGDEHRLAEVHGSHLRRRLLDTIGADVFAYQQRKHAHGNSCGYDTNPLRATFEFGSSREDLLRQWEEIALGDRQTIDFKNVVVEDTRFGRAVVRSDLPSGAGTLTIAPQAKPATLYVESADRFEWVSMPAQIYSTLELPMVPAERTKVRIKAGPLSITMSAPSEWSKNGEAALSKGVILDETTRCKVGALANAARVLLLLTKQKGATVHVTLHSHPDKRRKLLRSNAEALEAERLAELEEWIAAGEVAARYGLEDLEVDPLEVLDGYPGLTLLQSVLKNAVQDLEFSVDVDGPVVEGKRAVIMCPAAVLGDKVLVACIAAFAVPDSVGGRLVFKPERLHVEDVAVVPRAQLATFPLGDTVAELGTTLVGELGPNRVIYPRHANGMMFLGRPNPGNEGRES